MLSPENDSHIRASEEHAPRRLARADVAQLRDLYAGAFGLTGEPHLGFKDKVSIFLDRNPGARALARLGRERPRCQVDVAWTQARKGGEWGLDVTVTAVATGVLNRLETPTSRSLKVGTHRFRKTTTQTQFCREVSHLVRLGLGWSKRWST